MDNINGNHQSFEKLMEVVRRRGWLGLGVFLLGLALTLTFVWSLPPLYQGSATLVVADSAAGNGSSGNGNFGVIDPPPLDAVTQQVLGRSNLAAIIAQNNLYPKTQKEGSAQSMAARLRKNVSIEKNQISLRGGIKKRWASR